MTSNENQVSRLAEKWARRAAAGEALYDILRRKAGVRDLEILDAKRAVEDRWVFIARLNGEKVVLKRFLSDDPAATVARLRSELDYLQTVFTGDGFGVNRCLHAWPESGIAVLSFVPGPRLGTEISRSSGEARSRLMEQSGEWLRRYCAPRQQTGRFSPRFWIRKVAARPTGHIHLDEDRALLEALLACLRRQVAATKGVPILRAATHGDYAGVNAHVHEGTIYGIDIQGECRLPVAKDAARFLVWLQVHGGADPGRGFGIAPGDVDAFLTSGILSPEEAGTTLPFFIGTELYGRFLAAYAQAGLRENARRAVRSYVKWA